MSLIHPCQLYAANSFEYLFFRFKNSRTKGSRM